MNNSKSLRRHPVISALLALMGTVMALSLFIGSAYAQDPDFDNIDDPLMGEYELNTVDDLLISRTKPLNSNTQSDVLNYILETENETISSQSVLEVDTPTCLLPFTAGRQPQQTRIGRFFALGYDVIITLSPYGANATGSNCSASNGEPNMALYIQSTISPVNIPTAFSLSAINTALAKADFNRDGLDDLFIMSNSEVVAATAKDVTNINDGMKIGPATALPSTEYESLFTDPTTGDFNHDGLMDVAWIDQGFTVRFATVCPGAVQNTICSDAAELQILLDPQQSQANPIVRPPNSNGPIVPVGGRFDVAVEGDGLVLVYATDDTPNNTTVRARWYQFTSDWAIAAGSPVDEVAGTMPAPGPSNILAEAGRLDWFGPNEQVIFAASGADAANCTNSTRRYLITGVVTFEDKTISAKTSQKSQGSCVQGSATWLNGLAMGHFATLPENPAGNSDYNQQYAVLLDDGSVTIYSVEAPTDYTPKQGAVVTLESSLGLNERRTIDPQDTNWLVAGDLRGRSDRVSAPTIARVSQHMDPSVILGHPPMHVDFILPDESTAVMTATVNFGVVPNTYYSQYNTATQNSNQSSNTNTTSNSFGYSESASEKFKVKIPFISSLSGSFTQAWAQQTTRTRATNNYTYSSQSFDSSTNTGFGDQVWFTTYDFNIYYYPVLGQTVCPSDQPNCTPSEEEPLYVQYSGPSNTESISISGPRAEWYQPVHEPGQVFSYPSSYAQLQDRHEGLLLLSKPPAGYFTDDSPNSAFADWATSSITETTTGSVRTHSFKTDNSITVGPPKLEQLAGSGVQVSGSFGYNSSSSASSLNVTQATIGSSTGVKIFKPRSFRQPGLYQYLVEPYIFGLTVPTGTVQSIPMSATLQTTGPIHTAFIANPLYTYSGSWWAGSPYNQHIDIALNHPQRWAKTSGSNVNIQGALNCLQAGTSTVNCVTLNDPEPDDLWNSEFYQMRGLFVTVDEADGPQRATGDVGDEIVLQARVYNYSLKEMASTSKVHVRFYRQEIDGTVPVNGTNVLIAEETLDPLPPFSTDTSPDGQNWAVALTSFEATADMADKYFIFWVVVWAEDESGQLVQELPYHGLSAIPGTLNAIGDVPLEEVTVTGSNGDPKTTSFSNNVGYLHQPFYIGSQQTASESDGAPRAQLGELRIDDMMVVRSEGATGPIAPEERLLIMADVTSLSGATEGASILFYEGKVDQAPTAYDVEVIPHIRGDSSFRVSIPYRPISCGTKELVIIARGSSVIRAEATTSIEVPCVVPQWYMPLIVQQDDTLSRE